MAIYNKHTIPIDSYSVENGFINFNYSTELVHDLREEVFVDEDEMNINLVKKKSNGNSSGAEVWYKTFIETYKSQNIA